MKINSSHGLGNHFIIDGFGCDSDSLDNERKIKETIEELVKMLEMKMISEVLVVRHEPGDDERGITAFVAITESNITIHTYPEKGYITVDIFSCKEFDIESVESFLKSSLGMKEMRRNLLRRGCEPLEYEKIGGVDYSKKNIAEFVGSMKNVGFQATNLSRAVDIIKKMKKNNATIFISFTSNMVSSGLRETFAYLVKNKLVDVVITSVGSIEEDLIKSKLPFLLGDFNADDADLHRNGVNRIGNIFVPNDRYSILEKELHTFFAEMLCRQKSSGKMISPSELIFELGKRIDDENSIMYWATKNNIPIFCPAITDGALGLDLYFFKNFEKENSEFGIDVTADMNKLADMVYNSEKTGGIILGGGVAKHHLIGVNIVRGGLDYAVYVSTGSEYDGSLSGARPKEAVSWSKINKDANHVFVEGDATIIFPLIVAALV
ncbi:MAG: deoxyhypusine synthase [Candidatus Aenigmatarchaeota archaeon]